MNLFRENVSDAQRESRNKNYLVVLERVLKRTGGISSSVLSVFFTDTFYKLLKILASDWLRANLSVKNTDKMLDEMPP